MSLSKKVIIIITLVVFAAFSAGGTVLLATNSRAALAESVAQNSRRKQMSCYALESKLLADRLNGRKTDKAEFARYADKMVAYATEKKLKLSIQTGRLFFQTLREMRRFFGKTHIPLKKMKMGISIVSMQRLVRTERN